MRTASNSPLTQKYGDKTTHVSITVLFVLKLIGSLELTKLLTGPKKCRFSNPIGKNRVLRGPPQWCLNMLRYIYIYINLSLSLSLSLSLMYVCVCVCVNAFVVTEDIYFK